MRIKFQIILLLIFSIVMPILVLSFINYSNIKSNIEHIIYSNAKTAVEKLAEDTTATLIKAEDHLKYIAGSDSVKEFLISGNKDAREKILALYEDSMNLAYYYNTYFITDRKAMQRIKVYKDKSIRVRYLNLTKRKYIQKAMKGKSVIDIIISRITKEPIINFSIPVYDEQSRIIGVQSSLMNVQRFVEIISKINFTEHGQGFIMDHKGIITAHLNKKYILYNNFFKDANFSKETLEYIKSNEKGFIPYTLSGKNHFFYYQKLKKMDWIVAYDVPESDFYTQINKIKYFIMILTMVMLVVAILFALLFSRAITYPIQKLREGFEKVQNGEFTFQLDEPNHESKNEISQIILSFNQMVNSLKEKELIKDAFGKYVSKQILEKISTESINLGGETKEVTILFSDIRGFTKMSEKMSPQEVVDFLNDYFSKMVEAIFKYEGTVDKFIGDGIMAVFGAPIPHEDDAKRAIKAAMEMNVRLSELNAQRKTRGLEPINIGVAIHTGECLVGNIGTKDKMEYTAIGDTVNLTSRMESMNKQFQSSFIISERTYELVAGSIEVRKLPKTKIRGKEDVYQFYEVLRFSDDAVV